LIMEFYEYDRNIIYTLIKGVNNPYNVISSFNKRVCLLVRLLSHLNNIVNKENNTDNSKEHR
jgi:hypothetical protein